MGWFNDIIAQLWPYVNAGVSALAREQLDPMLSESKPAWIRSIKLYRRAPAGSSLVAAGPARSWLDRPGRVRGRRGSLAALSRAGPRRFDLGTKAPQANGVKVYKSEAVKDQASSAPARGSRPVQSGVAQSAKRSAGTGCSARQPAMRMQLSVQPHLPDSQRVCGRADQPEQRSTAPLQQAGVTAAAAAVQVIVEMDFIWAGDQDVQLVVKPIPNIMLAPEAVSKAIGSIIQLRVATPPVFTCSSLRVFQPDVPSARVSPRLLGPCSICVCAPQPVARNLALSNFTLV